MSEERVRCPDVTLLGFLLHPIADMEEERRDGGGPMQRDQQDAIRIAIVEDDADTRLLVRMATELDPRYDLVGEFDDLPGAVAALLTCPVDVVIVNRLESSARCCELLAQLRVAVGQARIVVADPQGVVAAELAVAAGADAFLAPNAFTHVGDALQLASGRLEAAA